MRNRDKSKSPGTIKTGAYLVFIAVIAVKTLRAVLTTLVTTYDAVAESRRNRRK